MRILPGLTVAASVLLAGFSSLATAAPIAQRSAIEAPDATAVTNVAMSKKQMMIMKKKHMMMKRHMMKKHMMKKHMMKKKSM